MNLKQRIEQNLQYRKGRFSKLDKAFSALADEVRPLGESPFNFHYRNTGSHESYFELVLCRPHRHEYVLQGWLDPSGIHLTSWEKSQGETVKVERSFEQPVTYLNDTATLMITNRLIQLGVWAL